MDELQEYELPFLLENISLSCKQDWIQTRYIIWSALKPHLKNKHAKPQDIFPLVWDEKNKDVTESKIDVTDDDITALKNLFIQQDKERAANK